MNCTLYYLLVYVVLQCIVILQRRRGSTHSRSHRRPRDIYLVRTCTLVFFLPIDDRPGLCEGRDDEQAGAADPASGSAEVRKGRRVAFSPSRIPMCTVCTVYAVTRYACYAHSICTLCAICALCALLLAREYSLGDTR